MIAIDGKALRGNYDKDKRKTAIHMVSAFSAANQLVLGQVKTANKSNEIKAMCRYHLSEATTNLI